MVPTCAEGGRADKFLTSPHCSGGRGFKKDPPNLTPKRFGTVGGAVIGNFGQDFPMLVQHPLRC